MKLDKVHILAMLEVLLDNSQNDLDRSAPGGLSIQLGNAPGCSVIVFAGEHGQLCPRSMAAKTMAFVNLAIAQYPGAEERGTVDPEEMLQRMATKLKPTPPSPN